MSILPNRNRAKSPQCLPSRAMAPIATIGPIGPNFEIGLAKMELDKYGLDLKTLEQMYQEWSSGQYSKSAIERRYLGKATHHGKLFTKLVRMHLGIETENTSQLQEEIVRLREILNDHNIDPNTGLHTPTLFSDQNDFAE